MKLLAFVLALLPILWLMLALGVLKKPAFKACPIALAAAILLALTYWKMPVKDCVTGGLEGVAMAIWPVSLVIIAAVFTYNLCIATGSMEKIKKVLTGGVKRPENPAAVDRLGIRRISGRYGWIWNSGCHSGGNPLRTWIFTNPCDGCLSGSKCNTNGLRLCRNTDGNIGAAYGNITGKSCMGYNGAVITVNLNHTFCDGDH